VKNLWLPPDRAGKERLTFRLEVNGDHFPCVFALLSLQADFAFKPQPEACDLGEDYAHFISLINEET